MKKKVYNKNPSSLAEQLQKLKDKNLIASVDKDAKAYDKNPLSFEQQLQKLKDRKLIISDDNKALHYLSQISYYRLSAYFLPYQETKDTFDADTTFKQIIDTYSFDRELRLLVFDSIERIEVAIRTQIIYCMATHHNNSHWQDDNSLFKKPYTTKAGYTIDPYTDFQNIIERAKAKKRPEVFIKHYIDNYDSPSNPPSWMCFELLTIGELSNIYRGLINKDDKKRIATKFDLHPTIFTSWLHSLTYVRNICAHHSRLWNKDLAVEPERLKKPVGEWLSDRYSNNNKRTFYLLSVIKYFLARVNPNNSLVEKLDTLFNKYPNVPVKYIGIPTDDEGVLLDWKEEPIWKK
jgi:abortive infection bacteriophage resistance protein